MRLLRSIPILLLLALLAPPLCVHLGFGQDFLIGLLFLPADDQFKYSSDYAFLTSMFAYLYGCVPVVFALLYTAYTTSRQQPYRWKFVYGMTMLLCLIVPAQTWSEPLLILKGYALLILPASLTFFFCLWLGSQLLRAVGSPLQFTQERLA